MPPTGLRSLSTNGNERKKAKIVVAIRPFRMIDQNDQGRTTREKKNLRIKTLNVRENRFLFAVFLLLLFLFPKTHLILLLLFFSNLAKKNFVFLSTFLGLFDFLVCMHVCVQ